MKLRLRSFDSKETLKIEVPNPCSLQQLKHTISRAISTSSSSSSLHLSLNRMDEVHASSLDDSLHSIGIDSGDLVFYTLNPNAFSCETLPHKPTPNDPPEIYTTDAPSLPVAEKPPTLVLPEAETTDMVIGSDEAVVVTPTANNSEASSLKRVVKEALGNDVSDFKLLVLAVHSVILESGFVRVDQVSGTTINCSELLDEWRSSVLSLRYTLPEILTNGSSHTVSLKIQSLGHIVNVCGSLSDDVGSRVHRVSLDKHKFARPLEFMLANSESETSFNDGGNNGNEDFELWKMVKDKLSLPLLFDLCEKAGLELPPCFKRLPMELKLMILEYLPGVDLAKVCSTCSELRCLASNEELWKKKFEEEFGQAMTRFFNTPPQTSSSRTWTSLSAQSSWITKSELEELLEELRAPRRGFKNLFGQSWITKKELEQSRANLFRRPSGPQQISGFNFMRSFPRIGVPTVWDGDFDQYRDFRLKSLLKHVLKF